MQVPHGAELTVFTPKGRALTVVPFVAQGSKPPGSGFAFMRRLALAIDTTVGRASAGAQAEQVFGDSGVYILTVSSEAGVSASLVCRVRYVI